jgi:hypothetical protein
MEHDLPAGPFNLLGDVGTRRFGGQGGGPLGHYPCQFGTDCRHLCAAFCVQASIRRMILALFLAWAVSLRAATTAFLSSSSLAFFSIAAFFLAFSMVLVVAMRETLPVQIGHVRGGGEDGEHLSLDLGNKIICLLLFVMRSVPPPAPGRTSPEVAVVGGTATLQLVGMMSRDGQGDLVLTHFLGRRCLVEVVVCGVVLCQHPATKITLCG